MNNSQKLKRDIEDIVATENWTVFDYDMDKISDFEEEGMDQELIIKCPKCNNIYSILVLEDNKYCPHCFSDLSEKVKNSDFWDNDDKEYLCKLKGCETDGVSNGTRS